jgi:hypothetical protein
MMAWLHRLRPIQKKHLIWLVLGLEILVLVLYGVVGKLSSPGVPDSKAALNAACANAAQATNPIAAENTCPGTNAWRATLPTGPQEAIEAFTAPISVNVGQSIKMYVSTTAPSYSFHVYRMGWYQGLGGHLVYSSGVLNGIKQPAPVVDQTTRMMSASNWHDPVTLAIPKSWVSGVYVVKLVSSAGLMRYTHFVVRNDASHAQVLFQSSVLTYQANNSWGGHDLDGTGAANTTPDRSYAVSFDRPEVENAGLSDFTRYEYDLLSWLERQGYDVTYTTDIDTDMHGQLLLQHRLLLIAGHDAYWSSGMRLNIEQARNKGVSLAFFGANDAYWHVRLDSSPLGSARVVICYKDAGLDPMSGQNPLATTYLWRNPPLNQPEQALLGAMSAGIVKGPAPLVLSDGAAPFLRGTTLHTGSVLPGLVGAEFGPTYAERETGGFDSVFPAPGRPSSLTVLASSPVNVLPGGTDVQPPNGPGGAPTATATLYTTPGGARVFDAGTYWWALGLQSMHADTSTPEGSFVSPDFQKFTTSLLNYLLRANKSPSSH